MNNENSIITSKLLCNLQTLEIKTLLGLNPQDPTYLYATTKNIPITQARQIWTTLSKSEKAPFNSLSIKHQDLIAKIKNMSKHHKKFSHALALTEASLNELKEIYSSLSYNKSDYDQIQTFHLKPKIPQKNIAFKTFFQIWKAESGEDE